MEYSNYSQFANTTSAPKSGKMVVHRDGETVTFFDSVQGRWTKLAYYLLNGPGIWRAKQGMDEAERARLDRVLA